MEHTFPCKYLFFPFLRTLGFYCNTLQVEPDLYIILLWLHHLTFSGAISLNGANVISNDIKPTKIQNVHLNQPDDAFKTSFLDIYV